ncbi:hypothetical protein ACEW9X_08305 [Latilactobacillus sakei]|uniref:hypothetical protein n=1 Tax=Latilactobacillus sakei TaxID=1599 RepID=UPI0035A8BB20
MTYSKKIYNYFILFFLIYTPEVFRYFGYNIPTQIVIFLIGVFCLVNTLLRRSGEIKVNKKLLFFYLGIIVSVLYVTLISLITGNPSRFLQNTYVLVQLSTIIFFLSRMKKMGLDVFRVLFQLASVQGVFCIIMVIFPSLKKIALGLYYLGKPENIFISTMRIYGISGDYTFFTPIYHGLLISLIVFLYLFEKKNYLIYLPIISIAIVLNGRTGLIIAGINISLLIIIYAVVNFKEIYKSISIIIGVLLFAAIVTAMLKNMVPQTYNWIVQSFRDAENLINGQKTGNFGVLADMFVLPTGKEFYFGSGYRLYGNSSVSIRSDIGYVNDMFMGGLIYCIFLYLTELKYLITSFRMKTLSVENVALSTILLVTFIISNYKGEAARGGLILIGLVVTRYFIDDLGRAE